MNAVSDRRRVVVVGGGVIGCATAYQLSRAGLNVTLIERDAIGAHASSHNAGNLNPLHATPPALIPFALDAFQTHGRIRAELQQLGCQGYAPRPVRRIHLGYDEGNRLALLETAALFANVTGFSSQWLDADDLYRIEPRLGRDTLFGVQTEGNLSVDGGAFTRALAEGATRLGAKILYETVGGIVCSGDRATGVRIGEDVVPCDELVLATGPWGADAMSWLGVDIAVKPVKGELLLMRFAVGAPGIDFTWGPTSLYRRGANEIWVGVTMADCGFDCRPTAEAKAFLLDRAARIMPAMAHATLLDHVAALRPMTADNTPIAGPADGWKNVHIANGGGAKGILLSVGIAEKIHDCVLGGPTR